MEYLLDWIVPKLGREQFARQFEIIQFQVMGKMTNLYIDLIGKLS